MIITIDGPAGTGKSTVARIVAEQLNFDFHDTGAMYRAIGLEALRRNANLDDPRELAFIAKHCRIAFDFSQSPPTISLNGEPVAHLLRGSDATRAASYVAAVPAIRMQLVEQQQQIGRDRPNLVTEGRDQGTVVFPEAQLKFYLDASPHERARRRVKQLRDRGEIVDVSHVLSEIITRDQRDSSRTIGPLAVPDGAHVLDTTLMSQDQVIARIVAKARGMQKSG